MQNFDKAYAKLNKEQKEAVDTIQGPVMVMAGPGTGKTQILTLRIANILRLTDTPPEAILAVTFTESGVIAMRKRLALLIGQTAYKVNITTFHGFTNNLIANNSDIFEHLAGRIAITEIDQVAILEKIFTDNNFREIKPFGEPLLYLYDAKQAIDTLKREGVTPTRFLDLVQADEDACKNSPERVHEKGAHKGKVKKDYLDWEKWIRRNYELAHIYEEYQKICRQQKLYDFSDMIMEVADKLENNEDFRYSMQESFQYLLIDEHQDTNNAQNKIIETMTSFDDYPNLFIVGDEKQAIFRFQGASLENFIYFNKKFPQSKIISLTENYRSSQNILDASHQITPSDRILKSNTEHNQPIKIAEFQKKTSEIAFIKEDVNKKIKNGVEPKDIAIIYRQNKEADDIISALESLALPYCLNSNKNILEDYRIKNFLDIFHVIDNPDNDELLFRVLHADFLNIYSLDILKVFRHANQEKRTLIDMIASPDDLINIKLSDNQRLITDFGEKILKWKQLAYNIPILNLFEIILKDLGYLQYINSQSDSIQLHEKMTLLFDVFRSIAEREPRATLKHFISHFTTIERHKLRLKYTPMIKNGVQLMTAHSSKGLEFEYVYIINAVDKNWGDSGRSSKFHLPAGVFKLEPYFNFVKAKEAGDEQNLFYVALTRAKKETILTYSTIKSDGKEQIQSQFINKIDETLTRHIETSELEISEVQLHDRVVAPDDYIEYVNNILDQQGLNVSALNNYLECPWRYFYVNLIRIPQAPTMSSAFGTAIHSTLDYYFSHNQQPDNNEIKKYISQELQKQPLSKIEIETLTEKARDILPSYIDHYKNTWMHRTINELKISMIPFDDKTFLRGQIDMLELLDDKNSLDDQNFYSGAVSVYDFKTGTPKSRTSIENPDGEHHNYFRQLVFYKLLLDTYRNSQFKMELGFIDFIEPDDKNRFHREAFTITDSDVSELKELLRKSIEDIRKLAFWDKTCDNNECSYCALKPKHV